MNKYIDELPDRLKMDITNWPHQFTKDGKTFQIGETEEGPLFAVPMICVHCQVKYINGKENRPSDPCPARTKKREMKRILG